MDSPTRLIIDYTSGSTWELPLYLYERYNLYCSHLEEHLKPSLKNPKVHEQWFSTLSNEDQMKITKSNC